MKIEEFVQEQRIKGKITQAVRERWTDRIEHNGWDKQGRRGAEAYLSAYGRSIGKAKVVGLALQAEAQNCQEMAKRFWEEGFLIATGTNAMWGMANAFPTQLPQDSFAQSFPASLQPGKVEPMEVGDMAKPQDFYVGAAAWWGYPEQEGVRCLVFSALNKVVYQQKKGGTLASLHPLLDEAATLSADIVGPFVLDGEIAYKDVKGRLHLTHAKARKANKGEVEPVLFLAIHRALFAAGESLTQSATEAERLEAAGNLAAYMSAATAQIAADGSVDAGMVQIAKTTEEKTRLCQKHKKGKIWVHSGCLYHPGSAGGDIVRTE
jgi:hypothetical protein